MHPHPGSGWPYNNDEGEKLRRGCEMAKIMVSFEVVGAAPTVDELKERFGLSDEEIDASFGVVEIDPETYTYTILVEASAVEKVQPGGSISNVEGPFSNPRIEPFGPPEEE
jgi:hypothetical protein